jgi:hypothetical protein
MAHVNIGDFRTWNSWLRGAIRVFVNNHYGVVMIIFLVHNV